jgi:hypothetical protein
MATCNFTRGDLQFKDYEWEAGDGDLASRMYRDGKTVDRTQGYEVVYVLNQFAYGKNDEKAAFQTGERMLRRIPGNVQSRKEILALLEHEWNTVPQFASDAMGSALSQIKTKK